MYKYLFYLVVFLIILLLFANFVAGGWILGGTTGFPKHMEI